MKATGIIDKKQIIQYKVEERFVDTLVLEIEAVPQAGTQSVAEVDTQAGTPSVLLVVLKLRFVVCL